MTTRDSRRSVLPRLTLRRGGIGDRGDSTVEVAILALPMMLVTGMLLHGGFYYYARSTALAAATQGASTARTYNLADRSAGDARVDRVTVDHAQHGRVRRENRRRCGGGGRGSARAHERDGDQAGEAT